MKINPLRGTLAALLGCATLSAGTAFAEEQITTEPSATPALPIETYDFNPDGTADPTVSQVTSVNQLRDVSPDDFAFDALRNLVERYGCIRGYPDGTFRGDTSLSRFEFAAALNACLQSIEQILEVPERRAEVTTEDLRVLFSLLEDFRAEVASVRGRVDGLEGRVDTLEANQFSTTTKFSGEVAFTAADSFGGSGGLDPDDDDISETFFTGRIRLNFVTSFTGKDQLFTRLTAGTTGNTLQDELDTREGRFAFDGSPGNLEVALDRLHYRFPITEDLTAVAMAVLGGHHFYADTFNDGLEVGGGANGALGAGSERSPFYRLGISVPTVGIGFSYNPDNIFRFDFGYLAPNGSDPSDSNGIFDGSFSALGQLSVAPLDGRLRVGLTYIRGLDIDRGLFATTGTNLANFDNDADDTLGPGGTDLGLFDNAVSTDSFGFQMLFDVTPTVSLRGWVSFTDADFFGDDADGDILSWSAVFVVKDLIRQGSLAALSFGAEPYLTDLEFNGEEIDLDGAPGDNDVGDDIPFRLEGSYKFPLRRNITVTPGLIVLFSPNQNSDNDTVFIGALRTTFTF